MTPAKNLWHCFGCGIGDGPIDWVIKRQGVSFRHAVELLREGVTPLAAEGVAVKRSTVRALPPPVAFDADDQALLNQTVGYYHERLLAPGQVHEATEYLAARGQAHPELVAHFKLGVADRTPATLVTTTEYLGGFQRRVTNPRGYANQFAFQAFDTPSEDHISQIVAPEGVTVTIARDVFSKPVSISRGGNAASATRSYVYDADRKSVV